MASLKLNPTHQEFYLAQINVALMKAPLTDPVMAEFAAALSEVNTTADQSPGFVWRLQTETGNATDIRAYADPKMLVNLSVWQSLEQLKAYVYSSLHGEFFVRRRQWFERYPGEHFAMWWTPAGDLPTVADGQAKLAHLETHGDSPEAFTFARPFPPPMRTSSLDAGSLPLSERATTDTN
jgi:heme-degrading monooxygenase HmoA